MLILAAAGTLGRLPALERPILLLAVMSVVYLLFISLFVVHTSRTVLPLRAVPSAARRGMGWSVLDWGWAPAGLTRWCSHPERDRRQSACALDRGWVAIVPWPVRWPAPHATTSD